MADRVVSLAAHRAGRDTGELWLSKRELAAHLGFSTRTIDRWVKDGLPCARFGTRLRFQRTVAEAWLRERAA